MGRYIRGSVDEELSIGTLAATTLISTPFDNTVIERTLVSSLVAVWGIDDWTPAAGDGPLQVGLAHSDYSSAEIEAWIEATSSWSESDKISQEVNSRLVRTVGILVSPSAVGDGSGGSRLNNGNPIKTKLNWILNTGQTLRVWAYNTGSSAFATTVPIMRVQGHANLWPK